MPAFASSFRSRIHSIETEEKDLPPLIKFENGRVGFIRNKNNGQMKTLISALKKNIGLQIKITGKNTIESVRMITDLYEEDSRDYERFFPFTPTNLNSDASALKIFNSMKKSTRGECFSKAHVWAYEAFKKHKLESMKLFLFFTNRYIRKYNYKWWFHVAPMAYVKGNKRVLDRRYMSGPRMVKTWTDHFIKSKKSCPLVSLYSEYEDNQQSRDCYLLPTSMYYVSPKDIIKRDENGIEKSQFEERDLRRAYEDAFRINYNGWD